MMFVARRINLNPQPLYDVRFHPAFIDELADHPDSEKLLEEIDHDLSIPEKDLRKDAITKVREDHGVALFRYKPATDREVRILYSPEGKRRDVVMIIPRSSNYRVSDLDAAIKRVASWRES